MENFDNGLYNDYSSYLTRTFGCKVQKISVNGGFSCPNRDGRISFGGCTYCDNRTFVPNYCDPSLSIKEQILLGKNFFSKYSNQKYLAYFQSFSNTYAPLEVLKQKYEEALADADVLGLVIGTRPDCVDSPLLDYLAELNRSRYVMVEYGVESTADDTLRLINRGHTFGTAEMAIRETAMRGIATCAHLILGLPREDGSNVLRHAEALSALPLTSLKLHQLQIIRSTEMERQFAQHPEWFALPTAEEYIDMAIDFTERLNPGFVIERFVSQSPSSMRLKPNWGLKNYVFVAKLEKRMKERKTWQGRLYS